MPSLTPAQRLALDWHLVDYDKTRTLDHICAQITEEDPSIKIWELMKGYTPPILVMMIEALASEAQDMLKNTRDVETPK